MQIQGIRRQNLQNRGQAGRHVEEFESFKLGSPSLDFLKRYSIYQVPTKPTISACVKKLVTNISLDDGGL